MWDYIYDFFYDLWERIADVDNPMILVWTALIYIIVLLSIWKTPWFASYDLKLKVLYTILAGPIIYYMMYFVLNK